MSFFLRLAAAAVVAPASAALIFCCGVAVLAGSLSGLSYAFILVFMAVLYGFTPALLFGSIGATISERWLTNKPGLLWGAAGAVTTLAYVVVAVTTAALLPSVTQWFAPWALLPAREIATPGVIASILFGGFVGGLTYRALSPTAR